MYKLSSGFIRLICSVLTLLYAGSATAKITTDSIAPYRPVRADYTLEVGSATLTDTYLSPLRYSGWTAALCYDRWQAMKFAPEQWALNLQFSLSLNRANNAVGNASMWDLDLNISWGMYHKWRLPVGGINVGAGARAAINLGCLYTARNGNNPASAKTSATIDASVFATKRFVMGNTYLDLSYVTAIPLTGVFFSPDYGELYYEIYLGDHSGLAHYVSWDKYFRWNNTLKAGVHLGNTILTIGYRCNLLSTKINHLNTRIVTHAFIIGVGGEWLSVSPRRELSTDARIISAIF